MTTCNLSKLPLPQEMSIWDQKAIAFGIPEKMLMENAGREIFNASQEFFGLAARPAIFMGTGNNGGDAACLARYMLEAGSAPFIFATASSAALGETAAWHWHLVNEAGVKTVHLPDGLSYDDFVLLIIRECGGLPDLLADGLLGTGFKNELRPAMCELIMNLNRFSSEFRVPFLSIDIPSGINGSNGKPSPIAIKARLTVTLAAGKPGLLFPPAREYTGQIIVRQIQIPRKVLADCPSRWHLLDGSALQSVRKLTSNSHKNSFGHVFIIGGSKGYEGAAHLASAAALRAGAGLVTACAPEECLPMIKAGWPEIMTAPLSWLDGALGLSAIQNICEKASVIVIGPGLGRTEGAERLVKTILSPELRPPAVIDADALMLLARNSDSADLVGNQDVLTPHPGEAAALLGTSPRQVQNDRSDALDRLCARYKGFVILKGANTIIGQGRDLRILCPYDIPQLAIGGAGDVLAGCLGGIISSWHSCSIDAVCHATAMHTLGALKLAQQYPQRGFTASQLADALPSAIDYAASREMPFKGMIPWPA